MSANGYERDLEMMRTAAQQREWTTLQDTLKRLLAAFDPLVALTVAAERARRFLPTFERHHPDALWVRELLLTVISYASAPDELPQHAVNQFPTPGCGNFIMAVFDMARAVQQGYTVYERYSHITNATANVILAELQHEYFSRREEEYTRLRDPDTGQQDAAQIQYNFWLDGEIAKRDTAAWLQVADEVTRLVKK
jgi:hypothetical protein